MDFNSIPEHIFSGMNHLCQHIQFCKFFDCFFILTLGNTYVKQCYYFYIYSVIALSADIHENSNELLRIQIHHS